MIMRNVRAKAWSYEESFNMAYKHTRKDIANKIETNRQIALNRAHELKLAKASARAALDELLAINDEF
jgi:hypothetical protein